MGRSRRLAQDKKEGGRTAALDAARYCPGLTASRACTRRTCRPRHREISPELHSVCHEYATLEKLAEVRYPPEPMTQTSAPLLGSLTGEGVLGITTSWRMNRDAKT